MKIINRKDIKPIEDNCGKLQELYTSQDINLAYTVIKKNTKPHKHKKTEEIYFITKGKATVKIGDKIFPIKAGDVFSIPKNSYHSIQDIKETIEITVITHPAYDPKDVFY